MSAGAVEGVVTSEWECNDESPLYCSLRQRSMSGSSVETRCDDGPTVRREVETESTGDAERAEFCTSNGGSGRRSRMKESTDMDLTRDRVRVGSPAWLWLYTAPFAAPKSGWVAESTTPG